MTKTESAHLTAQTVLIESAEQVLQLQMAAGVRLAIPNTNNLIMVGPQEWIAKNVPGVEAMVAGTLTDERIEQLMRDHCIETREFPDSFVIDFARAIERATAAHLAATTQASTAQAEGTTKRMRDLAAGRIAGEIKEFEYSLAADRIQDLEGIIEQLKSAATSSTAAQAAAEVRDAVLHEAIAACRSERVDAEETKTPGDVAYNRAISHCIQAIRALRAGDTGGAA